MNTNMTIIDIVIRGDGSEDSSYYNYYIVVSVSFFIISFYLTSMSSPPLNGPVGLFGAVVPTPYHTG
jgi:hypothetical protein